MEKENGRKLWIDCVRGIAIALVVLGHYVQGDHPLSRWISSFHVALFFILSGVLLGIRKGYEEKPLRSVLIQKTKQLLYPYFTFSCLAALYYCLCGRMENAVRVLWLTVTLEGHNTLWFLPTLWAAECMFLVLLRSRIRKDLAAALAVVGTSVYAALQYYVIGGACPADEGLLFQIFSGLCRAVIGSVFVMAGYCGAIKAEQLKGWGERSWRLSPARRLRWVMSAAESMALWICITASSPILCCIICQHSCKAAR